MKRNTRQIHIRVTEDEATEILSRAKDYSSINHYIKCALAEFSDVDAQKRHHLIKALGQYYLKYRDELSWAGGNLNQVVKRANELALANLLPPIYVKQVIMPAVQSLQDTMTKMKEDLRVLYKEIMKQ